MYTDHKMWEMVEQAKKEADGLKERMADSIYFTSPEARSNYVPPKPAAAPEVAK